MGKRHAARPRLVVDNSSSSDSSTPCSRAKRSNGMCKRAGMPRSGQLRTVDSERSSNAPISSKPPNRIIKSVVVGMGNNVSQFGMKGNLKSGCPQNLLSSCKIMTFHAKDGTIPNMDSRKKHPYADFGRRLKQARIALVGGSAAGFARNIEMNEQTYRNYERGDRRPSFVELTIFANKGISLNWLFLAIHPMLVSVDQQVSA